MCVHMCVLCHAGEGASLIFNTEFAMAPFIGKVPETVKKVISELL